MLAIAALVSFSALTFANHNPTPTATSIVPANGTTITDAATQITATFTFAGACEDTGDNRYLIVDAVATSGAIAQTSLTCSGEPATFTYIGQWTGYAAGEQTVTIRLQQGWAGNGCAQATPENCNHVRDGQVVATYEVDLGSPAAIPATKDDCKSGAWMTLEDSAGNGFKNQGDCVSFVATDGKNLGSVAP
jgi:hypothetical protein